jgi:hypothetical protein
MKTKQPVVKLSDLYGAEVVCNECGMKYGKYSVGCSSKWMGTCDVCGEDKPVTEVRDYGYLQKGINDLKQIGDQVLFGQIDGGPVVSDEETAPYELGEITLKLTEEEVAFLNECLDTIQEYHGTLSPAFSCPTDVSLFENIEKKITALYEDYCVKYTSAPAMKAYYEKYNSFGTGEDSERWEIFRDAYNMGAGRGNE